MDRHVNLVKLCVGAEAVEDLISWQALRHPAGDPVHVTRMWPKREAELLAGGSLYWVFKGLILARQKVLRLDRREGADGILRCALVLGSEVVLTEAMPRRPFQGWRYLSPEDAPRDLVKGREREEALPPDLMAALNEMGLR